MAVVDGLTPKLLQTVLETRLDAMDKAIDLLQKFADKSPTTASVKQDVDALKELTESRFNSGDKAVKDAFAAAKEAIAEQNKSNATATTKSEDAFTKQIDQLRILVDTKAKSSDDKIDDIKTAMTRSEGRSKGLGDGWGYLVGAVGIVWGVVATIELITKH
jgi:hypothetical protein